MRSLGIPTAGYAGGDLYTFSWSEPNFPTAGGFGFDNLLITHNPAAPGGVPEIDAGSAFQPIAIYDATMGDADDAFALLAGVLRSVDAGKATEWNIVGDGAWWIWNRVEDLKNLVGFKGRVTEVVDLYHARQKLYEFANEIRSFSNAQRKRWFNRMKKLLDQGNIEVMQEEFARYYRGCNSKARRKLAAYFERNIERMRYDQFKAANIPLGSGAVESCVRRLVNLRMKGNGIFWRLDNAERLLFL
jgi:hypothetical protein